MKLQFLILLAIGGFSLLKWIAEKLGEAGKKRLAAEERARRRAALRAESSEEVWEDVWVAPEANAGQPKPTSRLQEARADVRAFLENLTPRPESQQVQPSLPVVQTMSQTMSTELDPQPVEPSKTQRATGERLVHSASTSAYDLSTDAPGLGGQSATRPRRTIRLSRKELRRAMILREIVGPPLALRDLAPGRSGME